MRLTECKGNSSTDLCVLKNHGMMQIFGMCVSWQKPMFGWAVKSQDG
ncbi:hypothetical protein JMJ77_0007498, partial [Colletotrichum scovillei]